MLYSDNLNIGTLKDLNELDNICEQIIRAFSKYGLFFKEPVEPFCQMDKNDPRLLGEKESTTLGYKWDLQYDQIQPAMEITFVSKKRGMSKDVNLLDFCQNEKQITKRSLAVLTASTVSTDGILSIPLQLGAKLLLSRASALCPEMEN